MTNSRGDPVTKQSIVDWLKRYISNLTEIGVSEIDVHSAFDRYGFDSYQGVVMTFELGEWLGVDIDPSDTFDHPSIAELADFLTSDPRIQAALSRN